LRQPAGDREKLGEGVRWLSRLHWWNASRREAEAAAARAIAVLETLPASHQLAMAYSNQAQLDRLAYRTEAAMSWAARAIELARRLDDQETLTHALTNIGSARIQRLDPRGRGDLRRWRSAPGGRTTPPGRWSTWAPSPRRCGTTSTPARTWTGRSPSPRRMILPRTASMSGGTALACGWTRGTGRARSRTLTRCWPSGCGREVGWRRRWRRW